MSTATALTRANASAGDGPNTAQTTNVRAATATTAGTNHAATASASRCTGARLRWASPTSWTIRASTVSLPTFVAVITKLPVVLTVPPIAASPGCFITGTGSPVSIDSSTGLRAVRNGAVHRHLFAGPDPEPVAGMHVRERHVLLGAVGRHAAGGGRGEAEQRADGGPGVAPGAEFEDLPQQDERDDHRGGFEVDRDDAVGVAEPGRERLRRDGGDGAVAPGGGGAEADQGEHVGGAVPQRLRRERRTASRPTTPPGPRATARSTCRYSRAASAAE